MMTLEENKDFQEKQEQLQKIQADLHELRSERERIAELLRAAQAKGDDTDSRARLLLEGDFINAEPLKKQLQELDATLPVHERATELANAELEKARRQVSLEICNEHRPAFVAQVRKLVQALKVAADANAALDKIRGELETAGVHTGSLPFAGYDIGGLWNDPHGGRLMGFRKYSAEHFPEVRKDCE